MVIQGNPDRQTISVGFPQRQQVRPQAPHRRHRVGQDQSVQAARQNIAQHRDHVGVHERLPPGEADQARGQGIPGNLVQIVPHLRQGQIGQTVVARR